MSKLVLTVVPTSNFPEGLAPLAFEVLGPEWVGERLEIPFGPERERLPVIGWANLFLGSPCDVHVVRARGGDVTGYLVYGGDAGVRILTDRLPASDAHLPSGEGRPLIWIADAESLPAEVRAVVG